MVVLGLDISTSCTGYCILELKNKKITLIKADAIKLTLGKDLYQKAAILSEHLNSIVKQYSPSKIVVEENLQSFRPGLSSAKTILSLAKFNGIACYVSYKITNITPISINVTKARSLCGLKISRKSGLDTKTQVLNFIKNHPTFSGFNWPTKTLKNGPRRGMTIEDPSCFDIADAAIITLSSLIEQS